MTDDLIKRARYCGDNGLFAAAKADMAVGYSELADTLAAQAAEIERLRDVLDMTTFRLQLMVDRMPADEDGKSLKALCQSYVNEARAALRDTTNDR